MLGRTGIVIDLVEIVAPLPEITAHIVQAPRIGMLLADRARVPAGVLVKPGELAQLGRRISRKVESSRAGPAGVLKFGLCRQPLSIRFEVALPSLQIVARLETFGLGALVTVPDRIGPTHLLDRVPRAFPP